MDERDYQFLTNLYGVEKIENIRAYLTYTACLLVNENFLTIKSEQDLKDLIQKMQNSGLESLLNFIDFQMQYYGAKTKKTFIEMAELNKVDLDTRILIDIKKIKDNFSSVN